MSDAAIACIVTGIGTVATTVIGFLTLWIKLKYGVEQKLDHNTEKLDHNTELTKEGTKVAAENAEVAADAASTAAKQTAKLADQFNGSLDNRITSIVKAHTEPILQELKAHVELDERNMVEIRKTLKEFVGTAEMKEFSEYVKKRNHDMLEVLNNQSLKMDLLMKKLEDKIA